MVVISIHNQFEFPIRQSQLIDYPLHFPTYGNDNEYRTALYAESSSESSNSSGGVEIHNAECLVGTRCDVAYGDSDECGKANDHETISSDDDKDHYEDYTESNFFDEINCFVCITGHLHNAKSRLPKWSYWTEIDWDLTSMITRRPSLFVWINSLHSDGEDSFVDSHFDDEHLRWYRPPKF